MIQRLILECVHSWYTQRFGLDFDLFIWICVLQISTYKYHVMTENVDFFLVFWSFISVMNSSSCRHKLEIVMTNIFFRILFFRKRCKNVGET